MMALRHIAGVCFAALLLAFTAGTASATTRGVTLITPKSVNVTRDSSVCADSTGNVIPCLVVNGSVKNSGLNGYRCQVVLNDLNFTILDTMVFAGQTLQWNVTTPYTGQKDLTFSLFCAGTAGSLDTDRVRISVS
jgi:hypothetical protein